MTLLADLERAIADLRDSGDLTFYAVDEDAADAISRAVDFIRRPELLAAVRDKSRIDWLQAADADLVAHHETFGVDDPECEYTIWWNVVKDGKSISGHPLGCPRAAIDESMSIDKARSAEVGS